MGPEGEGEKQVQVRHVVSRAVVVGGVFLASLGPWAVSYGAAHAEEPAVQVLDVPRGDRWSPREAEVLGASTRGFLYSRAGDAGAAYSSGTFFHPFDGTPEVSLGAVAERAELVGERVVVPAYGSAPRSVSTTVLGSGQWSQVAVPDAAWYVGATGDGMLVGVQAGLQLLPWAGGSALPVTGLPEGVTPAVPGPIRDGMALSDEHAALVASSDRTSPLLYVDTTLLRAWSLPGAIAPAGGVGPGWITWFGTSTSTERVLHRARRPVAEGEALVVGAVQTGPPSCGYWYDCVLTVLADGSLLLSQDYELGQYAPTGSLPVQRAADDGSLVAEQAWGHGVAAAPSGGYLVVTGTEPRSAGVRLVTAQGSPGAVQVALAPVPERLGALALDGARLVTTSDATADGALSERAVVTSGVLSATAPSRLAQGVVVGAGQCSSSYEVCGVLAADGGATAWHVGAPGGTPLSRFRAAAGQVLDVPLRPGDRLQRLSGATVLAAGATAFAAPWSRVYDAAGGPEPVLGAGASVTDLLDGVAYGTSDLAPEAFVARDLTTGASGVTPFAGLCSGVQVAGSSVLGHSCEGDLLLLDRRTGQVSDLGPLKDAGLSIDRVYLGNGFVAKVETTDDLTTGHGVLSWTATDEPAHTWRAVPLTTPIPQTAAVAVSRGTVPLLAWLDEDRQAHVARLPVAPSSLPERPQGVAVAPAAPAPTASAVTGTSVTLTWPAASAADEVRRYTVTRAPGGTPLQLPASATSVTLTGLQAGKPYALAVKAENVVGGGTAALTVTPRHETPIWPSEVRATVDRVTSRVTVTWKIVPDPQFSEPVGFRIATGGNQVLGEVGKDARSASFVAHQADYGQVLVYSIGEKASWPAGTEESFAFPGDDRTRPQVTSVTVAPVVLSSSAVLRFSGTDDRKVQDFQVARRSAATGQALSAWSYPTTWSRLTTGALTVSGLTPGSTTCFAVRARDAWGNLSSWSAPACTVVALDDRSLTRATSGWATSSSSAFYGGSAATTTRSAQALRRNAVRAEALTLVATRCPTCGTVGVYDDGVLVAKASLVSSTTTRRALVGVPLGGRRTGTLTLKVLTSGKPVTVDGLALRSY